MVCGLWSVESRRESEPNRLGQLKKKDFFFFENPQGTRCPRSLGIDNNPVNYMKLMILEKIRVIRTSCSSSPRAASVINLDIKRVTTSPSIRSYIYLGLVSYRLTIKERNGGVGIRGKNRVVDESASCVTNVNCKSFCDGETKLL